MNTTPTTQTKPRRWPWIAGIVAALLVGFGIAGINADTTAPIAAEPETVEVEVPGEIPAADLEALEAREAAVAESDAQLAEIAAELDAYAAELDEREAGLEQTETEIAEGTFGGNGVYIVGEDVTAGEYKNTEWDNLCYYEFKSSTGADADIVSNGLLEGPGRVTLSDGDIFETVDCGEWVKQ